MKKLNETEAKLLVGALKSIKANQLLPLYTRSFRGSLELDSENQAIISDANQNVVPLHSGEWLGVGDAVTGTLATQVYRGMKRLESKGLIERIRLDNDNVARTTHIRLLPAGEKLAKQLTKDGVA